MVFRCNAQTEPVVRPKRRRRRIQIIQCIDINPCLRHCDDQISTAKMQFLHRLNQLVPQGQLFLDQIGARHPQMNAPRRQFTRYFTRRQQHQRDIVDACNSTGILTLGPCALQRNAARAEPFKRLFHQPALGRHTQFDRHCAPSNSSIRPGRMTPPTAGISAPCPKRRVSAS